MFSTTTRPVLTLEALEAREVPAVLIQLDYSRDVGGFFNNAEARATLEQVATELGNNLNAGLAAITPGGGNTWTATFFDPASGGTMSLSNLSIGANTIRVFVGARALGSSEAGFGGYGGYSISGTQSWLNTVQGRGSGGFAPWGGSITFDSNQRWHFGGTTSGLDSNELDFYSVAVHELGHVLGLGTAPQWRNLISGGTFRGSSAMGVYGGAVPVSPGGDHWADGVTLGGQSVSLDPTITYGQRVGFTSLDFAALRDLGWGAGGGPAPAPAPAPAAPAVTLVPFVNTNGTITQYAVANGRVFATGAVFTPFPGYRGPLHQAVGDYNRDGVLDVAVATVGNRPALLAVISGADGSYIGAPTVAFGGVLGMLGADLEGDGTTELIVVEANPLAIYVYNVRGGLIAPHAAFAVFGQPGRAALTASGELDRTGNGDTISEYTAEQRDQAEARANAPYTVSADPMKKMCTCAGCAVLAQMAADGDGAEAAPADDLLAPIRLA